MQAPRKQAISGGFEYFRGMELMFVIVLLLQLLLLAAAVFLIVKCSPIHLKRSFKPAGFSLSGTDDDGDREEDTDQDIFDRCCSYMDDKKPYLVSSFSLDDLSNAVYANKMYVSRSINNVYGHNFRHYVNGYRVRYAMDLFRMNKSLRVTELADMSGFNSPGTFSLAFKLMNDGESPAHWCAKVRDESVSKGSPLQ